MLSDEPMVKPCEVKQGVSFSQVGFTLVTNVADAHPAAGSPCAGAIIRMVVPTAWTIDGSIGLEPLEVNINVLGNLGKLHVTPFN